MKKYGFFLKFMAACLCLTPILLATSYEKNSLDQKKFRALIYKQTQEACLQGYICAPHAACAELTCTTYKIDPSEFKKMQKGTLLLTELSPLKSPGPFKKPSQGIQNRQPRNRSTTQRKWIPPLALISPINPTLEEGSNGALAQEEDLFRRSSYFLGLDIKHNPYLNKQMHGKYLIPEFGAIYTPQVHIIQRP